MTTLGFKLSNKMNLIYFSINVLISKDALLIVFNTWLLNGHHL